MNQDAINELLSFIRNGVFAAAFILLAYLIKRTKPNWFVWLKNIRDRVISSPEQDAIARKTNAEARTIELNNLVTQSQAVDGLFTELTERLLKTVADKAELSAKIAELSEDNLELHKEIHELRIKLKNLKKQLPEVFEKIEKLENGGNNED